MRLSEIIIPKLIYQNVEIEPKLGSILNENCQKILDSGIKLYRGVDNKPNVFVGSIRTDRKLLSSEPLFAAIFDYYMEINNFPFRKANTLSTTLQRSQAITYGDNVYQIFPYDNCEYFAANVRDLMFIPDRILNLYTKEHKDPTIFSKGLSNINIKKINNYIINNINKINEDLDVINTDKPKELSNYSGEVIVVGTQYVAIKNKVN